MRQPLASIGFGLGLLLSAGLGLGCSDDGEPPSEAAAKDPGSVAEQTSSEGEASPTTGQLRGGAPIEAVEDCDALAARAKDDPRDLVLLPHLCPGLSLDHSQLRAIVLATGTAPAAQALIPALDRDAELQGLVRLAALDRASQALPDSLPDPATALLTPLDDRLLAAVELAHAQLRSPSVDETTRTRAHAYLARVYFQALHSLGLRAGRPLPPFARLLAGPALFHGRSFCRFYWQRRVSGLERPFAETEVELLTLLLDLDNTPHAHDPALLALERHRTRAYLLREGPTKRIAARAKTRPEARALDTTLLLPFAQELDRLFDQGFIDLALDEAMRAGAAAGGYGLDPVVAMVTEDVRQRDLREYERRLARRIEGARRRTPSARHGQGPKLLDPKLPVEWPAAAELSLQAIAWLRIAHRRSPDFARNHARARALAALRERPDALFDLLAADDDAVRAHEALLRPLFDAVRDDSLAALRAEHSTGWSSEPEALRLRYALASRETMMHPR